MDILEELQKQRQKYKEQTQKESTSKEMKTNENKVSKSEELERLLKKEDENEEGTGVYNRRGRELTKEEVREIERKKEFHYSSENELVEKVGLGLEYKKNIEEKGQKFRKNIIKKEVEKEDKEPKKEEEKPRQNHDIIVSGDGRTLEEILRKRRRIPKTAKVVTDYRAIAKVLSEKGVDTRYKETLISNKKKEEKRRKRLRKKSQFLIRNGSMTEAQKILMKNIKITKRELDLLYLRGKLTPREIDTLIEENKFSEGTEYIKNARTKRTHNYDILLFLSKFRWANAKIIQNMFKDKSLLSIKRTLNTLETSGFIVHTELTGGLPLYRLTSSGFTVLGIGGYKLANKLPKMLQIPPLLGANYIAACLWNRVYNILFEDEKEWKKKRERWGLNKDGEWGWIRGEVLLSEYEIRKQTFIKKTELAEDGNIYVKGAEKYFHAKMMSTIKQSFQEWEMNGRVETSPELREGNEYMFTLYDNHELSSKYHFPDLIIKRPRKENGRSGNIAIEFERNPKKKKILNGMMCYKRDLWIYDYVVWVVFDEKTSRMIENVAKEIGMSEDKYRIIPLISKTGRITNPNMWEL